ncbi:hypothetical protein [Brachybacterium avium]|uniref:hypothetical protein n=1 Tax=Brachybacterium avium TaxID=2017485 RepID=UPI0012FDC828|nr:hypothetical protein [Brachybacterium avium]
MILRLEDSWSHRPAYDRRIYELFFVCDQVCDVDPDFVSDETSEVIRFPVDDLPELSVSRVLSEQLRRLHQHWQSPGRARFD